MVHHEEDKSKIPDYRIYRVEDAPELKEVQDALSAKGLRDPWLRNEVWRFLPSIWGTRKQRLVTFFFRGFRYGFAAFLATIAFEGAVKLIKGRGSGGGGDHGGGGGDDGGGSGGTGGGEDVGFDSDSYRSDDNNIADVEGEFA